MSQVTAMSECEPHDSRSWSKKTGVYCKICWATTEWLDINSPLIFTKSKSSECAILAKRFYFVDVFITTIITFAREALRVLVGKA